MPFRAKTPKVGCCGSTLAAMKPGAIKRLTAILSAVVLIASGGTLAIASGYGSTDHGNAGTDQYKEKPGCGPDKTDGIAGNSGEHDGQPPKADERGDCPETDD